MSRANFTAGMEEVIKKIKDDRRRQHEDELNANGTLFVADIESYLKDCIDNQKLITKTELADIISDDHNLLKSDEIKALIDGKYLTDVELINKGIRREWFDLLNRPRLMTIKPNNTQIDHIDNGTTEVYMWGLPSSGKTCMLGALMAAARKRPYFANLTYSSCQDYGAIVRQIFPTTSSYCILPGRTPINYNFAVGTEMTDDDGKLRNYTFVDMSGELFCGWSGAHRNTNVTYQQAFREFENFFIHNRSNNPRIHIFIIEYHIEDDLFYKSITQSNYFNTGIAYLKAKNAIDLGKDRFIVAVTKSDLMANDTSLIARWLAKHPYVDPSTFNVKENSKSLLTQWVQEHYEGDLGALVNAIDKKAPKYVAFDIGEVCFQDLCCFNVLQASRLLGEIVSLN